MLQPDSDLTVTVLVLMAIACVVVVARARPLWGKAMAGVLTLVLAAGSGMAVVNVYFGYYTSWSQLSLDLSGSYPAYASTPTGSRRSPPLHGRVVSMRLAGATSSINRTGLVYLPPQYFQAAYRHTRFPVLELLHGSPGTPADWTVHLDLAAVLDSLISAHAVGPMIVVMPAIATGRHFEECVDAPGALDDTYITHDVRTDVLAHLRASPSPAQWGIAGFSSGGYCAANLALRHRASFGAAGVMDGYFRPGDGPAAAALHDVASAEAANDPILAARGLSRSSSPLPSFWLSYGTGVAADAAAASAFRAALHGVEQITVVGEPGAGHNFYAWRAALGPMLGWMWTQLAPPELRVRFPIAGPARVASVGVAGQVVVR